MQVGLEPLLTVDTLMGNHGNPSTSNVTLDLMVSYVQNILLFFFLFIFFLNNFLNDYHVHNDCSRLQRRGEDIFHVLVKK